MESKQNSHSANANQICKQIEYYFSDQNLRKDTYFHDLIENDSNQAIPIENILKCNKIKSLTTDPNQIIEAISKSQFVEASSDNKSIRRKDGKLPPLEENLTKKLKTNDGAAHLIKTDNGNHEGNTKHIEGKNVFDVKNPLIFALKTEKPYLGGRKQIQEKLEEILKKRIPYVRYAKVEGNFVVDSSALSEEQINKLTNEGLTIGDTKFNVNTAQNEELTQFWDKHGLHYKTCLGENLEREKSRSKKDKKERGHTSKTEITFGNQKYSDITKLKNIFRNILQQTSNDEVIKEPHHTMLLELLKFHENYEAKINNLSHFTANTHPQHSDSRCFFVVRKDGTQEDFSVKKCLETLETKLVH